MNTKTPEFPLMVRLRIEGYVRDCGYADGLRRCIADHHEHPSWFRLSVARAAQYMLDDHLRGVGNMAASSTTIGGQTIADLAAQTVTPDT